MDFASDKNYITHKAADRLRLKSEKVILIVHGGMTMKVNMEGYVLNIRVQTPKGMERAHELVCYGLDEIVKVHRVI